MATCPSTDATLMMLHARWGSRGSDLILAAAACAKRNIPVTFTSITLFHCSIVVSAKSVHPTMPALFTRTSIDPNVRTAMSTASWASVGSATSARHVAARGSPSGAAALSRSSSTSVKTTDAPASRRSASPMTTGQHGTVDDPALIESVRRAIADNDIEVVISGTADLNGIFRGKRVPATRFAEHPLHPVHVSDYFWIIDTEE